MKINKSNVEALPIPLVKEAGKTAQKRYYDDNIKGFGVRVTSGGTRAFFVEKLIKKTGNELDPSLYHLYV